MTLNEKKIISTENPELALDEFLSSIPNVSRACSTILENSMGIFLPHTRLDKSNVLHELFENNQTLTLKSDIYEKVEIKGRLLCQTHKDILEVLLTSKKFWMKDIKAFRVEISAYQIFKKLGKSSGNKKWLEQKLDEIAECRIKMTFDSKEEDTFNFGFISAIGGKNAGDKKFSIVFSPSYSHLMAKNEMLDYSNYVADILSVENYFTKAVIRYMLIHNGRDSKITIENLVKKLNLEKVISKKQLEEDIRYIRKPETQKMLKEVFGIELKNNETIVFNTPDDKPRYHIQPNLNLR